MLLRKVLFVTAALAVAGWTPAQIHAQDRGLDRAATASAGGQANAQVGFGKASAGKERSGLPAGIAKRFEDETLPPGIRLTRGDSEPEVVEPDPDPEVDNGCVITELQGLPPVEECEGTP